MASAAFRCLLSVWWWRCRQVLLPPFCTDLSWDRRPVSSLYPALHPCEHLDSQKMLLQPICSSYPLATHTEKCAFVHLHLFSPAASIVLTYPRTPCFFSSQWRRPCKISFPSFPCLLRWPTMAPCTKAALLRYRGSCPAERKWGALFSILQSQKKKGDGQSH